MVSGEFSHLNGAHVLVDPEHHRSNGLMHAIFLPKLVVFRRLPPRRPYGFPVISMSTCDFIHIFYENQMKKFILLKEINFYPPGTIGEEKIVKKVFGGVVYCFVVKESIVDYRAKPLSNYPEIYKSI